MCSITWVFLMVCTRPVTTVTGSVFRAITEYQMQAFADFLSEFDIARPDGSTLLDHGCIYGTSEYGEVGSTV